VASSWVETASQHFAARHSEDDSAGAEAVLQLLEDTRARLSERFPNLPEQEIAVVLHETQAQLDIAQPVLPVVRRLTTPASRRYLAGWFATDTIHILAPAELEDRASTVRGSREMLELTPAALYTRLVLSASNPALPPPWGPRRLTRELRWAWLTWGASQVFSRQILHARPAIARRLREGSPPEFPPAVRDAHLLGGTVVDLLAREEGEQAAVALAVGAGRTGTPREALAAAFHGRDLRHTEGTWRAHLTRLAGKA
jgi:hypothetical protein